MRRLIAPVLFLLVACSGGLPTSVTLRPADLPEVVLQASEAPAGTGYRAKQSRPEDLEKFARPGEQRTTLAAHGFQGAYRVSITSDAYVDYPSDPLEWGGDTVAFVENQAVVLKDAGAAREVLEYYRTFTTGPLQSPDLKPVDAPGLGEQAYGLRGLVVRTAPAIVLYWRRGNVFLSLATFGQESTLSMDVALRLAKAIDDRIAARAP